MKVTGLWKSRSGESISGTWGGVRLVILPNKYKTEDKHPDYVAYLAPIEPKEEKQAPATPSEAPSRPFMVSAPMLTDEDIPF
jgi:hypothetical protein